VIGQSKLHEKLIQMSHTHRDSAQTAGPSANTETGRRRYCHHATVTTGYLRGRRLAAGGYEEAPGQVSFRA